MALAPREREKLAAIETRFNVTDPGFAAMFRLLGSLGRHRSRYRKGHQGAFLSVWLARYGWGAAIMLLGTIAMLLAVCAAAAAVLA